MSYLFDVCAIAGGLAFVVAVGMYSVPAGVMVGGAALFLVGVTGAWLRSRGGKR